MNYIENKEKFYNFEYAAKICDSWKCGAPFFIKEGNEYYDAFLFYTENTKSSIFGEIKMLILVSIATGETKNLSNALSRFSVSKDFGFTKKSFASIDEYFDLEDDLEESYEKLRAQISNLHKFKEEKNNYIKAIQAAIPEEIIQNIYTKLSPDLFCE